MRYGLMLIGIGFFFILSSTMLVLEIGIWNYYIFSGFWNYSYTDMILCLKSICSSVFDIGLLGIELGMISIFINSIINSLSRK